jgi:hypothetical protein
MGYAFCLEMNYVYFLVMAFALVDLAMQFQLYVISIEVWDLRNFSFVRIDGVQ